ncbi:MAG: hypothetical protein A2381_17005 [Bdellovibrionales bacterium RIFOXYB1_FULL_37_110]|nr:MAG: hypothetical protein A2181_08010 [Bdellovibrionales bacterium RIFOXYA1_FULL_38_20]OFZ50096.1 MAG: hypothetical protein A2417_18840 [Bdellovibrionales bacterium RIFOXYC1_FULL_37_79]OFZ60002.1 MAG: hypothetical protein A2381_17005 [Bdellovibrionales bacterium RIFOXYB1_FULL_37_110]OFZ64275.1 MAG: hypothetical protein A2577_12650 [Bdellovibrionales bacterium RIFOXYD1_FULL_36_51]
MINNNAVWAFIEDLQTKQGISEIVINTNDLVFIERENQFIQLDLQFEKKDIYDFLKDVAKINNKKISLDEPILDGSLPDGSRINAIIEPFCTHGPAITIRKYIKKNVTLAPPYLFGLNDFWAVFLKALVHSKQNILISGGTGVGKTTFLNMLLAQIDATERLVIIEDTKELEVLNKNQVRLEVIKGFNLSNKILTVRDLVKNTLRMRPDRIIIGEVRGEEIFDLLQAMNVGHDGSMTSVHASSSGECFKRLESLFLLSGYDVPYRVIRRQIASAVNYIIQLEKDNEGKRFIAEIIEITGIEGDMIQVSQIALQENGELLKTGRVPKNIKELHKKSGLPLEYFADH